jgi:hypothetical protein
MLKKIGAAGVMVEEGLRKSAWYWDFAYARALAIRHRAVTDYDRAVTELIR